MIVRAVIHNVVPYARVALYIGIHAESLFSSAAPRFSDGWRRRSDQFFLAAAAASTGRRRVKREIKLCVVSPVHTSNIVEATFDFVVTNGNNVERVS